MREEKGEFAGAKPTDYRVIYTLKYVDQPVVEVRKA